MGAVACGIVWGIALDLARQPSVIYVEAHSEPSPPKEVRIEVIYNWDEERIKEEIVQTFPESPALALKIAQCESGFKMIQSNQIQPYGREESYGIFQIHARAWHEQAVTLGYEDYQTDIRDNLAMARHIYENQGWRPWSCLSMV